MKIRIVKKLLFSLVIIVLTIVGAFYFIEYNYQSECKSRGGEWIKRGVHGSIIVDKAYCKISYQTNDAGKTCSDNSQCQSGLCLAPEGSYSGDQVTGVCHGETVWPNDGCVDAVKNGNVVATQPCSF